MLRQRAQHALSLCAEACWLAPSTKPSIHCSTPCWLVQYYQCADWRAGCVSPRVARELCGSTPRRMGAAEAARQAAGIAAAKAPALCFAFARVLRQLSVYHKPPNFTSLFLYRRLAAAYSRILVEELHGGGTYSRISS